MKYRIDYVTNSSSSSFVIFNIDSPTIKQLFDQDEWHKTIKLITENQFASATLINESVVSSIAMSLLNSLCFEIELKNKEQSSKLESDLTHVLAGNNLQNVAEFIEKWLPVMKEDDVPEGIIKTIETIKCLIKHKDEIDRDTTGEIKVINAQSDGGGPFLDYSCLNVVNGDGTYTEYIITENNQDKSEEPSEFKIWAKEHGYYDGDFSDDLYWANRNKPIYDEIANTFEEVKKKNVKNGKIV